MKILLREIKAFIGSVFHAEYSSNFFFRANRGGKVRNNTTRQALFMQIFFNKKMC